MSAAAGSTHPSQPGLAVLTAEQRENYETLTTRRKEWLTELAPDFDRKTRADATGLAFNILLSGEDDPKQAMMLAVEQISARQALQDQLGRNLFLSSEADPPVDPPRVQQVQAQQQIQPQQNAAPHPPQLLAPLQEGNPQLAPLQEGNNVAPVQVPEKPKDKGKAKRVDSDSDDAKRKKKKNEAQQKALLQEDNPLVQHRLHRPTTKQWKVEGTSLTSTDKKHPKGFVPDHDLSPVDFLYAIDQWVDTMRQEGVDEVTCQAWKRFNTKIRKHTDWPDPSGHGKKQLQLLHNHQRICFASETRQEKAKKRAIKRKYSSKEKRAKALGKLVKFDPAEWPAEAYNEIEKRTTMSRLDSWENRPFRANDASSSTQQQNNNNNGNKPKAAKSQPPPSQQPQSRPAQQSFRTGPGLKACARCGSRAPHDPRYCTANVLASDSTIPTFCVNDANGRLVTRIGSERVCPNYNTKECLFPACFGKHACSLCGKTQCNAQRCPLATNSPAPGQPSAQR
ncbi:unnamed protein product [Tilletia caries]|nr:unnamed protein product [Tilletia caries]